jgi:hypothetical protein
MTSRIYAKWESPEAEEVDDVRRGAVINILHIVAGVEFDFCSFLSAAGHGFSRHPLMLFD